MAYVFHEDQSDQRSGLKGLAANLALTPVALENVRRIADILFSELREKSIFDIRKTLIGGSVAKGTAIRPDHDVDCIVFVADAKPPFGKIRKEFEEIIASSALLAAKKVKRRWGFLIQADINGMKFDIVPAAYFSDDVELQRKKTLERVRVLRRPKKDFRWSSSMEGSRVDFIKRQSPFVHDVIRLAKYWNKNVTVSAFITGRTSLMECIAVHAAQKEERLKGYNASLLQAFKGFLGEIQSLKSISLFFEDFYTRSYVKRLCHPTPMVLDPCNPYSNVASGLNLNPKVREEFQRFAEVTLARLKLSSERLEYVFETQPVIAPRCLVKRSGLPLEPIGWCVEVTASEGTHSKPNVIIRREGSFNPIGKLVLQSYLWNSFKIVNWSYANEHQLAQQVWDIITLRICGQAYTFDACHPSSVRSHLEFDVTFEVPAGKYTIKVSLNWLKTR